MDRKRRLVLLLCAALLLFGCGAAPASRGDKRSFFFGSKATGTYEAPELADSVFHADQAVSSGSVKIDVSSVHLGYVCVSAKSDHRLKFQVVSEREKYNYDLSNNGAVTVFPLQDGNGSYKFRVMENVVDSKYAELFSTSSYVTLQDEFQPFLRPNVYVPYTIDSKCVKKASELAGKADTALEVVTEVYKFICSSVKYDRNKAATVQSGYLPDPDETLRTGKGICFDYAALAAAMLRSQGIPTKEIFGYVSPDGVYHAWNMFYTEETGWVTVTYKVVGEEWNRMDLTFSANGADSKFIGDGDNYSDLYSY